VRPYKTEAIIFEKVQGKNYADIIRNYDGKVSIAGLKAVEYIVTACII